MCFSFIKKFPFLISGAYCGTLIVPFAAAAAAWLCSYTDVLQ
jgi:cell division protein FtsX